MNIETVNNWLCKNSPISSSGLREKMGVVVKGTPIATRLSDCVSRRYATVEKGINPETGKAANIYTSTDLGRKLNKSIVNSPKTRSKVESVDLINSRNYKVNPAGKLKNPNALVKQLMGTKAKGAMGALAELLAAESDTRKVLKGVAIKLRHEADNIDFFLNSMDEESKGEDI